MYEWKEHEKYVVYEQIDKSALVEHVEKNKEHDINFNEVKILDK